MSTDKTPLENFKDSFLKYQAEFNNLPLHLTSLLEYSEKIVEENKTMQKKIEESETKIKALEEENSTYTAKIEESSKDVNIYKEKLQAVEEQMQSFRKMYEDMAQEREKEIDIQELLAIYTVLFEQIFSGTPHTKILILLQASDKTVWLKDEIVKTTGYTAAAVLKAIHDLRNNNVVDYNEDTYEVRLKQKVF